ncbi:MAG: GNAT family N-acetyltransferase [Rhodospirillales bacterium]|nr:GNAT family N-acetyltransferase [Rhodospirillales bacterium]
MPEFHIEVATTAVDLAAALAIRREVFCDEQGVSEAEEMDGLDPICRHYLVRLDGPIIGTARVRAIAPGRVKIQRVAILKPYRRRGLGALLMQRILADASREGIRVSVLDAQCYVATFYVKLGFSTEGEVFEEASIPHVHMTRTL